MLRAVVRSVEMSPVDSMTTKRPSPLTSPTNESRESGAGVGNGVAVGEGVGEGVGVGVAGGGAGIVLFVIWKMAVSGVGESVCARALAAEAAKRIASAKAAAAGRGRRKACFTKNPPSRSISKR